jgi:tetratricopeptide (TPR) repeat protein
MAFDLSYRALPPDTARLFRLLGLVPGPDFGAELATAMHGADVPSTTRMLARLVDASLLTRRAPGRYVFHDLLRLYAAELATNEDSPDRCVEAIQRMYVWYLHSARAAASVLYPEKVRLPAPACPASVVAAEFADLDAGRAWLDAERPNLVAAINAAVAGNDGEFAWLLADALRGYYWLGVDLVEWEAVASAGLAAAAAAGAPAGRAATLLSLADLCRIRSRHAEAVEHYTQAVEQAATAGWSDGEASALGNLGSAYFWLGELSKAATCYRQAYEHAVRAGRLTGQAVRLGNLGLVSWLLGDLAEAADYHTRAVELDRQVGSRHNEALDLENLGETTTRSAAWRTLAPA